MRHVMKAAVAHEFGAPLHIEEVPLPRPAPNEILVRVQACGVCHTDLHAVDGDWPVKPVLPLIPGHEGIGLVAAVGRDVAGVKEGDRVGMPWLYSACGTCEHCLGGWETLCEAQRNTGYGVAGSYADYVIADPRFVGHLPPSLDFAAAAPILCAGVTVYKGLKCTGARPGQWVAISGVGGLGHVAIQYARAMGLHVAAVDVDESKLDLARRLGAEIAVNARQQNVAPSADQLDAREAYAQDTRAPDSRVQTRREQGAREQGSRRAEPRYRDRNDDEAVETRVRADRRRIEQDDRHRLEGERRVVTREEMRAPPQRDGGFSPFRLFGVFE